MQTWLFVALPLVCLDSAGVWLLYQAINWVFANPVTNILLTFVYNGPNTKWTWNRKCFTVNGFGVSSNVKVFSIIRFSVYSSS